MTVNRAQREQEGDARGALGHLRNSQEAADALGINLRMVYALCDRGDLAFYLVARRLKFADRDLETFLERRRHEAAS